MSQDPTSPGGGQSKPAASLARALASLRYELIPIRGVEGQVEHLPAGATVTVMCSPTKGPEPTIALAERLAARDLRVVPHLSARTISSRDELAQIVERLVRAGIRDVFVIGGDAPEPWGPYPSAWHLLEALCELGHDFESVGIAAYPEPHPLIDDETLKSALRAKQPFATYMVTQMCFDADVVTAALHRMRERGIHLPVRIGIAAPVDTKTLLKICMKIGVRDSGRFLAKHTSQVGRLLRHYRPDDFLNAAEPHFGCETCRIEGLHAYVFNQIEPAEAWRRELMDSFEVGEGASTPSGPPPL